MKLKSLLLGSAAALALSTGAQAADPIVEFVSLGVCDAYGITGLTIESDDTCLSISGEVEYEYTHQDLTGYEIVSDLGWELAFEATTQTDAGAAVAKITLIDAVATVWDDANGDGIVDPGELSNFDSVEIDEAYVQFGDTTVLSAGKKGSIFDGEIIDTTYGGDAHEVFDWSFEPAVETGNHVIQIESLVADGFTVLAALEDLNGAGTAGLGVQYDAGGISGEAGVLIGDLYGPTDPISVYARVNAEFDAVAVRAGVLFDDPGAPGLTSSWVATLGATATLDMFTLDADAWFQEGGDFGIGAEGAFDATDTIEVYLGAAYEDEFQVAAAGNVESFTVYGGVNADITETLSANAEVGYVEHSGAVVGDYIYGVAGVTYAPGGGFETGLSVFADTDDHYKLTFEASKEF